MSKGGICHRLVLAIIRTYVPLVKQSEASPQLNMCSSASSCYIRSFLSSMIYAMWQAVKYKGWNLTSVRRPTPPSLDSDHEVLQVRFLLCFRCPSRCRCSPTRAPRLDSNSNYIFPSPKQSDGIVRQAKYYVLHQPDPQWTGD
jgi:hypothetical protein